MKKSVTSIIAGGLSLIAFGGMSACTRDGGKTTTDTRLGTSSVTGSITGMAETTTKPEVGNTAPDLTNYGLKYNAQTKKYETTDNRYGKETKEAGVFVENVYLNGENTGGLVLPPNEVKKVLKDALAKIPEGQGKWMLFVPADISNIKTKVEMEIVDGDNPKHFYPKFGLKISFSGDEVSISNPVVNQAYGLRTNGVDHNFSSVLMSISRDGMFDNDINQSGLNTCGNFTFLKKDTSSGLPFGTEVAKTSSPIIESVISMTAYGNIDNSRILELDGHPVFVMTEK